MADCFDAQNKRPPSTSRRPRVTGPGVPFLLAPGAVVFTSAEDVRRVDVVWRIPSETAVVVIHYPAPDGAPSSPSQRAPREYLVLDPHDHHSEAAPQHPGESVYRRRGARVNLVTLAAVQSFFAGCKLDRIRAAKQARPAAATVPGGRGWDIRFKTIVDTDVRFALPPALFSRALKRPPPSSSFDDTRVAFAAMATVEHTLVVPSSAAGMPAVYASFFRSAPHLARAPYNWCSGHPFAAAVMDVCTRGGGPVSLCRGAFVFNDRFWQTLADRFPRVLARHLALSNRGLWQRHARFRSDDAAHAVEFDTSSNAYVDAATGESVPHPATHKRRYVWVEPEELGSNDPVTRKTRAVLVAAFAEDPHAQARRHSAAVGVPVLPPCLLHTLHLKSFPGLGPPVSDHLSRSRLAYIVNALSNATGIPPLEVVDHSRYLPSLRKDQKSDYLCALRSGDRNPMSGPLCKNTTHDPREKGLTCVSCPRACGRPNNVPESLLLDLQTAKPLTCMNLPPENPNP